MATTTTTHGKKTTDGRVQNVPDSRPSTEAKALSKKDAAEAHDKAYPTEPLDTPLPSDPALVQAPQGTATPELANRRAQEKPAPEHVEAEAKTDTVPPYPAAVEHLKSHNERRAEAGENVEPVGPGNATDMTDRGAPAGDLPEHHNGRFLHPQTKEQLEATKRYSEPHEPPVESIWVTTTDGEVQVKGAVKGRIESNGSLSLLAGPLDPAVDPKVVKRFRAGSYSYWGKNKQP